jgi:ferredoxin
MKAKVDPDRCLGCGICEGIAPEIFELGDEGIAVVESGCYSGQPRISRERGKRRMSLRSYLSRIFDTLNNFF